MTDAALFERFKVPIVLCLCVLLAAHRMPLVLVGHISSPSSIHHGCSVCMHPAVVVLHVHEGKLLENCQRIVTTVAAPDKDFVTQHITDPAAEVSPPGKHLLGRHKEQTTLQGGFLSHSLLCGVFLVFCQSWIVCCKIYRKDTERPPQDWVCAAGVGSCCC